MINHVDIPFPEVTGVILAGGQSSRMGSNKALLPIRNGRFIEIIHRRLNSLFGELLIVANSEEPYRFLGSRIVADRYPGLGVLAGLHAALAECRTPYLFAVACDMPFLNDRLIRELVSRRGEAEVIIPETEKGLEPLHAVYSSACLRPVEAALAENRRRVVSFFPQVRVLRLTPARVAELDPGLLSLRNINTPEEYFALREKEPRAARTVQPPPPAGAGSAA
ncbi:hypothetical protein GMST_15000 [Geomonas silvestris]|uniref:Probable molybdenum cofactor guanylyltransferase n=1 Tax=Geomonas silvestris TaxID=2740184 RepID=A0A6V8MGT1_9BACT|nr:molybdenum cofactor guanylyltransferase [Geomonas silvestris]GFO59175.1 hypothetical protein GMST_15000 [Geomonas silvestris]